MADVVLFMHSSVHLDIDFENDWTIKELNYAHAKKKRVVLVKLDGSQLDNIFLMEYGSKNNIDSRDETQFQKLLKDMKAWLGVAEQKQPSNTTGTPQSSSRAARILGKKYEEPASIKTFYYEDGKKMYEGETRNGLFHGQGTYYYINGDKYEGQYKEGEMHGLGSYHFSNGYRYEGEFRDNKTHGEGTLYYTDGRKYVGMFKEGKRHGSGTFQYPDGKK